MENNDVLVDLVIPIYNLRKHRYNNFCYLIQQISKLHTESLGCNVVVCEQESNSTSNVENFLTKYTNIKHYIVDVGGSVFNKSSVINHAYDNTYSEFFWICDCDLIFNFEYVINNLNISSDFIKPFEYVTPLDEIQSEYYMKHNKLMNTKRKYISNNCTGKYSFIVRRTIFDQVGRMNEDFEGWGFQDLDFSENRMKDYKPNIISGVAYHLYHEPASRKHVDRNRRLYMNLGGTLEYTETPHEEPGVLNNKPEKPVSVIDHPIKIQEEPKPKTYVKVKKVNWSGLSKHIVCHRVLKSNIFNVGSIEVSVYDESWTTTSSRSILNRNDITQHQRHYLYWYLTYIVDNYNNKLADVTIFLTDSYLKTKSQLDTPNYKNIMRFLEKGTDDITTINYIAGKVKYRQTPDGHFAGVYNKKSRYTYSEWNNRYLSDNKLHKPKTAPMAGCIMVPCDIIYKRSFDFYRGLLKDSVSWTDEDYAYLASSLDKVFS